MHNKEIPIERLDEWLLRMNATFQWDATVHRTGRKLTCYYIGLVDREVIIERGAGDVPESGWEMYENVASRSSMSGRPVEAMFGPWTNKRLETLRRGLMQRATSNFYVAGDSVQVATSTSPVQRSPLITSQ